MESTTNNTLELHRRQCVAVFYYLRQSEIWYPRRPRPPVKVAEMDKTWRYNAIRYMERRAVNLAHQSSFGEIYALSEPTLRAVVGEIDGKPVEAGPMFSHLDMMGEHAADAMEAHADWMVHEPLAWLRSTSLILALNRGLPTKRRKLEQLAARAAHWTACPGRVDPTADCRCQEIKAAFDAAVCQIPDCGCSGAAHT